MDASVSRSMILQLLVALGESSNAVWLRVPTFIQMSTYLIIACILTMLILMTTCSRKRVKLSGTVHHPLRLPPIVKIPSSEIFTRPQEAYESALRDHGPVVGAWRKGRLEYIVGPEFTKDLFSNDQEFSFEDGVATILNLPSIFRGSRFFKDVHLMISGGVIPKMEEIVDKIFPIFQRQAKEFVRQSETSGQPVDLFEHSHRCISEAMLIVALGQHHVNEQNIKLTEEVAHAIAIMTGIYQNTSPFARTFPVCWRIITWGRLVCEVILAKYCRIILPIIWKEVRSRRYKPLDNASPEQTDEEDSRDDPLLHYIARIYADGQGKVSFLGVVWLSILILAFIFASVHQTASVVVWVMFELSTRPEEELSAVADSVDNTGAHRLSYESLRRASTLDSFVREVLRFKGDTLSLTRETTRDVPLGEFVIPKGHLVLPLTTLTHQSQSIYGDTATTFDAHRWTEGPPASMVSLNYLPFGVGRWACPGRILAITEIKMIVSTLVAIATPELEGGKYKVVDPLNITSVPPVE
ncbi:hypothetical protein HYDPIDRAFT_119272 [Hydnomerulius pinastri MD-312]|uniref:Unplaced genomic scaffold scaffold_78, whole genome shotgun sequence n=1 Tax=Hydnomerulius pinastri MD-312 TaxID=994086 RepID=A0A0C9VZ77_9AGAM|nr:hypothetical protein HYDPIDRAFT_119272 [Hydnomerulius pinastri MD-312]